MLNYQRHPFNQMPSGTKKWTIRRHNNQQTQDSPPPKFTGHCCLCNMQGHKIAEYPTKKKREEAAQPLRDNRVVANDKARCDWKQNVETPDTPNFPHKITCNARVSFQQSKLYPTAKKFPKRPNSSAKVSKEPSNDRTRPMGYVCDKTKLILCTKPRSAHTKNRQVCELGNTSEVLWEKNPSFSKLGLQTRDISTKLAASYRAIISKEDFHDDWSVTQ